ncbi:MAG TPA: hypothetical protein VJ739_06525, partial [Gemmataceae bacterium]|nr:hypothetical protein [Gemmataceae bacterium]
MNGGVRDFFGRDDAARRADEERRAAALKAQEERQRRDEEERAADVEWLDLRAVRERIRFTKELDGTGTFRYGPVFLKAADLPGQARERLAAWGDMSQWLAEAADDPTAEVVLEAVPLVLEHGANPVLHGFWRAQNVAFHTLQGWRPKAERMAEEAARRELAARQAREQAEYRAAEDRRLA